MILKNDRLLRVLRREPVDATPVWIMRQAGRYLPEYRAVRQKAGSFLQLCHTPELAAEVTLQPLERFDLDAAIVFSDILTVPEAMGLELYFAEGEGPGFHHPIRSEQDLKRLQIPDPTVQLGYVMETIQLVKKALSGRVPLIGFSGSPWTIACYMIEGQSKTNFPFIKKMRYQHPALLLQLLEQLTEAVTLYLTAQALAGADVLMLFDTWGSLLSQADYPAFSLSFMQRILQQVKERIDIPFIVFTKGGSQWLPLISQSGCEAVGVDWTINLHQARQQVMDKVALQGNLDPAILYAPPEVITASVQKALAEYGSGSGHIFNLGHGIFPDVDPERVACLVEAVHRYSPAYHSTSL